MKLSGIAVLMLALIAGCENSQTKSLKKVTFPVMRSLCQKVLPFRQEVNMQFGSYYPLYVGEKKDTLLIDKSQHLVGISPCWVDWRESGDYSYPKDSTDLTITLDTTQLVCYAAKSFGPDSINYKTYKGYPVVFSNPSTDTIRIGTGFFVSARLEAKSPKGEWLPIEEQMIAMDENGYNRFILPPKYMAVFAVPVYQGSFQTELRFRYRGFTSAPFAGAINPTQLDPATFLNNFDN